MNLVLVERASHYPCAIRLYWDHPGQVRDSNRCWHYCRPVRWEPLWPGKSDGLAWSPELPSILVYVVLNMESLLGAIQIPFYLYDYNIEEVLQKLIDNGLERFLLYGTVDTRKNQLRSLLTEIECGQSMSARRHISCFRKTELMVWREGKRFYTTWDLGQLSSILSSQVGKAHPPWIPSRQQGTAIHSVLLFASVYLAHWPPLFPTGTIDAVPTLPPEVKNMTLHVEVRKHTYAGTLSFGWTT